MRAEVLGDEGFRKMRTSDDYMELLEAMPGCHSVAHHTTTIVDAPSLKVAFGLRTSCNTKTKMLKYATCDALPPGPAKIAWEKLKKLHRDHYRKCGFKPGGPPTEADEASE